MSDSPVPLKKLKPPKGLKENGECILWSLGQS